MYCRSTRVTLGLVIASLALVMFGPGNAQAQFFQNTNGISNPVTTITFDEVPLGFNAPLTNQYSAYGVTFSNLFYSPQNYNAPNISGNNAGNFQPITNPFSVFFNVPQTSAAIAVITNAGVSVFTALLGGVTVATGVASTDVNLPNDYYGFTGVTFDEIQISAGGANNAALIDNIQVGTNSVVPEGNSLLLLGAGMIPGAFFLLRRRKPEPFATRSNP